jgi:hypothetical protein
VEDELDRPCGLRRTKEERAFMIPKTYNLIEAPLRDFKNALNVNRLQERLGSLLEDNKPLEVGYPIILQFLGTPWDRDTYTWGEPLYMGRVRNDIVNLCWTQCRLNTALIEGYNTDSAYNGELVQSLGPCRGICVTLFQGNFITEPEEAFKKFRAEGIYVRTLDDGGLLGGSHMDASSGVRVIEQAFRLEPCRGRWNFHFQGKVHTDLSLHDAVDKVIETISPRPNIEAPKRVSTPGQVQNYSAQQDPLKPLTPEELERVPPLTPEVVEEALKRGREECDVFTVPMIEDSGRRTPVSLGCK